MEKRSEGGMKARRITGDVLTYILLAVLCVIWLLSVFGFPDFLPQKEKNDKGEQPGYWYRILDMHEF